MRRNHGFVRRREKEEIIRYLNNNNILQLSIKLDKKIPDGSADEYGKKLGLPESPVYCLSKLADGKPCVLILDQLDALRWTATHSASALDVCMELISQADTINKHENGHMTIIFASRTFDLETDNGIKSLFKMDNSTSSLKWHKIKVDSFSKSEVVQIIGKEYEFLSSGLKKILEIPSSLFVWLQLEPQKRTNNIISIYQLMNAWWQQVQERCEKSGLSRKDAAALKNIFVSGMEKCSDYLFL